MFHRFDDLPKELQLNVWAEAISGIGPRLIECRPRNFKRDEGTTRNDETNFTQCIAIAPIPSILQVCKTSRAEALKQYPLMFHKELQQPAYFDKSRDVLMFAHLQAATVFFNLMDVQDWQGVVGVLQAPSSFFSVRFL